MKRTNFMTMAFSLALLAALTIFTSGCSQRMYSQQSEQNCVETYSLQEVLAGVHGVDQYGRPLNACGYPVNVYGEVIGGDICPEAFYHQPDYVYLEWLSLHYGFYHPVWGIGFFHPCYGPRIFHREYSTGAIRPTVSYRRSGPNAQPIRQIPRPIRQNNQPVRQAPVFRPGGRPAQSGGNFRHH